VTICVADLGSWGGVTLVSEYDPEGDAIRINARAIACVRAALGRREARRFVACAIAHERFHRTHPRASEAQARAYAAALTGADAERYAAVLAAHARAS
jgi:hypothetical protein